MVFRRSSDGSGQGFIGYSNAAKSSNLQIRADGGGGYLTLRTGGSERARLDNSGNLGIGTSTPSATLHVLKSGSSAILSVNNLSAGSGQTALISVGADASGGSLFATSSNYSDSATFDPNPVPKAFYIRSSAAATGGLQFLTYGSDIVFKPGSAEAVRFKNGGYVGIGTQAPTVPLEVSGTVSATHFVGDGSGLTGIATGTSDRIVSGSTNVIAKSAGSVQVSGSLQFSGSAADTCSSASDYGTNRMNPVSGRMQVCLFR